MTNQMMEVTYETMAGDTLTLNRSILDQFVKKGNSNINDQEAFNFLQLCKATKLNPFLNEVYLVKFGTQPAQMITSKEAYMKRANNNPNYNGFKAGITILSDNQVIHREGQSFYKQAGEKLLGGWAKVSRKDIDQEFYQEVSLDEYSKGQATWKQMPGNMIRKVALVGALREAFPDDLGGMYTQEEPDLENPAQTQATDVTESAKGNDLIKKLEEQKEPEQEIEKVEVVIEESAEDAAIKQAVAKRIKEIRESAGLSQEEFAEEIGTTPTVIEVWEIGDSQPNEAQNKEIKTFIEQQKIIKELEADREQLIEEADSEQIAMDVMAGGRQDEPE